jgi:hypothetical protein
MLPLFVWIPSDGTMILSISKFRILAFSITIFGLMTLSIKDNQHNYTQQKRLVCDTQPK